MKYKLQCGHTGFAQYPSESLRAYMVCPVCGFTKKLLAVETREWHVRCVVKSCPYGKWTGQDKESAEILARRHRQGCKHDSTIDYQRDIGKVNLVESLIGQRRVKTYIEDLPHIAGPRRYSRSGYVAVPSLDSLLASIQFNERHYDDKPPF